MPTGYTADVADGKVTDFPTFALQCARAFGACIMQRDDPAKDPPKHREPSEYYAKSLEEAKRRVNQLNAMTMDEAEQECEADYQAALARHAEYEAKDLATRNRYNAMLAQVVVWEPPTDDHRPLKEFMLEQLRESRKFDDFKLPAPIRKPVAEWLRDSRELASRSLQRAVDGLADERDRCAKANAWIDALYASLDLAPCGPQ